MNVFFLKHTLTEAQIEAARAYVRQNFGNVPAAPSKEWEDLAKLLEDEMNRNDLSAWIGHLLSTPLGMVTLARLRLGLGAPEKGVQWLGMRAFVDSCNILIDRGFPPAAADIGSVTYDRVDGTATRDNKYHGPPDDHEATGGSAT